MRNYLSSFFKSTKKGFTLIELLVVIGILGVLAAALIATIDPFEQLKKAQDASTKNTVVEFIDANIRYYATHNAMPWDSGQVSGCSASSLTMSTGGAISCIGNTGAGLIGDGELKDSFVNATGILKGMSYFGVAGTPGVTTCYKPQSKSGANDPGTVYNSSGVSVGGSSGTYWCAH